MNRTLQHTIKILAIFLFLLSHKIYASDALVDYPVDYRFWTHVKSMVIQEGHPLHASFGGIHHIYANELAIKGYKTGIFPDGSVIIFDLLDAVEEENAIVERKRKVLGVMQKDTRVFKNTAGWGFEGFVKGDPDNRVVSSNYKEACFSCHTAQKASDYVFSKWRQ